MTSTSSFSKSGKKLAGFILALTNLFAGGFSSANLVLSWFFSTSDNSFLTLLGSKSVSGQ